MIRTDKVFVAACEALAASGDFRAFYNASLRTWSRVAVYLLRRWRAPTVCSREDMEQELILAAWRAAPKWEAGRGPTLAAFVLFNAVSEAKRWLHVQRGVSIHGNPDRSVSEFLPVESSMGDAATRVAVTDESPFADVTAQCRQEVAVAITRIAPDNATEYALAAAVISRFDADAAAELLWSDPTMRRRCRLHNESEALRIADRGVRTARHKLCREVERARASAC